MSIPSESLYVCMYRNVDGSLINFLAGQNLPKSHRFNSYAHVGLLLVASRESFRFVHPYQCLLFALF
jgi:hypothetical protein